VRHSGDIDVYVTAGDPAPDEVVPERSPVRRLHLPSWGASVAAALTSTAVAWLLFDRDQLADIVMTYLLGVMIVASRFGLGASVLAAFLSVVALDYIFIPPYFTLAVQDFRHSVTFIVMFSVAIVISGLTERIRNQAAAARQRERRTAALYELSRELVAAQGGRRVIEAAVRHLEKVFESKVWVLSPGSDGRLERSGAESAGSAHEASIAEWVWANQKEAGLGTTTLPSAAALYVPLMASGGIVGVLALCPLEADRFRSIEQRRQIDAFAAQLALAMERANLAEQTEQARREVEKEQLRSSLLSSVSHDLRTPLAVITGSASTILQTGSRLDDALRLDLMKTILEEAERLNRLIRNLLDMTRLDSGTVRVKREWLPLEEIVGAALHRLEAQLKGRELEVQLSPDLPLVACDVVLTEQALINLLENAIKYSDGPITIKASRLGEEILVEVADRGPGIAAGQETRIFEKFYRAVREGSASGVGLGLSICRAILAAQGGRIWAQNREGGGASFRFTLPILGEAPKLELPEAIESNPSEPSA
jgi:two-component system sensor histidine kinase KdpD